MSMLFTWNDCYELGYKDADDGHRLLIEAVNRLNRAGNRAHRDGEVSGLLPVLETALAEQYRQEESVLRLLNAPNLEEHRAEHARFLAVLSHIRNMFDDGMDVAGILMLNLVCHLVSHIRGTDQDAFSEQDTAIAA